MEKGLPALNLGVWMVLVGEGWGGVEWSGVGFNGPFAR